MSFDWNWETMYVDFPCILGFQIRLVTDFSCYISLEEGRTRSTNASEPEASSPRLIHIVLSLNLASVMQQNMVHMQHHSIKSWFFLSPSISEDLEEYNSV